MDDRLQLAGNVLSAATFLAGLLLAYLGSTAAAYLSYPPEHRGVVLRKYWWRAWLSFAAFLGALVSAVLALLSRWHQRIDLLEISLWILVGCALAGIITAFLSALEMK